MPLFPFGDIRYRTLNSKVLGRFQFLQTENQIPYFILLNYTDLELVTFQIDLTRL